MIEFSCKPKGVASWWLFTTTLLLAFALTGCFGGSSNSHSHHKTAPEKPTEPEMPVLDESVVLPVVFVHGLAGSGSQYQTQALRFASNGYPENFVTAFEYSTAGTSEVLAARNGVLSPQLDVFIDDLREEHDVDQVYLACHSLGTSVCGHYLSDSNRAEKVAKYIAIDGATGDSCPGDVPCLGVFAKPNAQMGTENLLLPDETHVQVATSEASFAGQFEFLTGTAPLRTTILQQKGLLKVSGRAVNFPANSGAEGSTLQVWEIDGDTGNRKATAPLGSFLLSADGSWGPVELKAQAHYEFNLLRPGRADHHFYRQPFLRNSSLVRFNTSPAGSAIEQNTHSSPDHSTLVITRDMEWWATRAPEDTLEISTTSLLWGDQDPVSALLPAMGNGNIGLHVQDDEATPALSSLSLLSYFDSQPFQSGVDIYMPASSPTDGTITIISTPRGMTDKKQTFNVPNWASDKHKISLVFNDFVQ